MKTTTNKQEKVKSNLFYYLKISLTRKEYFKIKKKEEINFQDYDWTMCTLIKEVRKQ